MVFNITIETDLSKEDLEKVLEFNCLLYRLNKACNLNNLTQKQWEAFEIIEDNFNKLSKIMPPEKNKIDPRFKEEFRNLEIRRIWSIKMDDFK